jgi:hypothetical protein
MKWSQGLCAAILLDGFYSFTPKARPKPRQDRDLPDVPSDPSFFANALAPDWDLPAEASRGAAAAKWPGFETPRAAGPQRGEA